MSVVLADPHYPEHKRFCSNPNCLSPVGRSADGRSGLIEGFCPQCRTPFSFRPFEPRLVKGDLVGGQYEVVGCIAHGGVGWVMLALDRHLDDMPVVLKGLIDADDAAAQAAAEDERRFLTEVQHSNIVRIYNFVQHPDPLTGTKVGYIVMEYVGGQALSELRKAGPLPLSQVLSYGLEILGAFEFLHGRGLLFCDLKPANAIHSDQHQLKLIDLGAVRRMDDTESQGWHSVGYSDPRHCGNPSIATDLYTVARTMAVLSLDFRDYRTRTDTIPGPDEVKLLARHDSYYRFLLRATHPDQSQRFDSAAAMADQLRGVLREVAAHDGQPRPEPSTLFAPEVRAAAADAQGFPAVPVDPKAAALALPDPQVNRSDPQAGVLAALAGTDADEMLRAVTAMTDPSAEARRQVVLALIELERLEPAAAELVALEGQNRHDWRLAWCRGLIALMKCDLDEATASFEAVYDAVPGEAAPKLALAVCAELAGDSGQAADFYETVWRTDNTYASAAFGVARARFWHGDRVGAAKVLESVPEASRYAVAARLAAIMARVRLLTPGAPLVPDTLDAANRLPSLADEVGPERYYRASAEVLEAVLAWRLTNTEAGSGRHESILGVPLTERGLRFGLERCYRALAEKVPRQGVQLVDRANKVRPWTWR
jgi:serine/threonine-protein kinase PknG